MTREDGERRRDDLAATSESIHDDAQQIARIEEEKQGLEIGDPRLTSLSNEAERLAGHVQHKSRVERALSEGRAAESGDPEAPLD